VFIISVII